MFKILLPDCLCVLQMWPLLLGCVCVLRWWPLLPDCVCFTNVASVAWLCVCFTWEASVAGLCVCYSEQHAAFVACAGSIVSMGLCLYFIPHVTKKSESHGKEGTH